MAKILVVDDESVEVPLLRRYLCSTGHSVVSARTVLGALAWLNHDDFDFVVIDTTGRSHVRALALCRVLKSDPRTVGVKVLFLGPSADTERKAKAAGADACLTKPYAFSEIDATLESLSTQGRAGQPVFYGLTVNDAIKAYSMGMFDWARGQA